MTKEELKFLMSRGFTVSELLEIEGDGTPKQPAPAPADPDPAPADPSEAKIAALEASKPSKEEPVVEVVLEKTCPICGAKADSKFCPQCGAPMGE